MVHQLQLGVVETADPLHSGLEALQGFSHAHHALSPDLSLGAVGGALQESLNGVQRQVHHLLENAKNGPAN